MQQLGTRSNIHSVGQSNNTGCDRADSSAGISKGAPQSLIHSSTSTNDGPTVSVSLIGRSVSAKEGYICLQRLHQFGHWEAQFGSHRPGQGALNPPGEQLRAKRSTPSDQHTSAT